MAAEIDIALLRRLLRYEPETGRLYWLPRTPDLFKTTTKRTAQHSCNAWNSRCANKQAFTRRGAALQGTLLGKTCLAHRVAWALHCGAWPENEIDHINGNRHKNNIQNMRDVTHKVNSRNLAVPATNTSGIMGVSWHKQRKRWRADIKADKYHRHLGYFEKVEDAVAARKAAERDLGFHRNHGRAAA